MNIYQLTIQKQQKPILYLVTATAVKGNNTKQPLKWNRNDDNNNNNNNVMFSKTTGESNSVYT